MLTYDLFLDFIMNILGSSAGFDGYEGFVTSI